MSEKQTFSSSILSAGTGCRKTTLISAIALSAAGLATTASAELSFATEDGWKFGMNGHVPVFAIFHDSDAMEDDAFRITTGFNPATAQFNIYAPTQNGLDISAHFQLNSHLAGADGVQNSGFSRQGNGRASGVESRVAEIAVAGSFGTVYIGKGFGIFGTPAIGDNGSELGVGLHSPNNGDATAGRIGNGYFYSNFNPRVIYASNDMSGLQFRIGAFQPEKPEASADAGTELPRIEANVVWTGSGITLWTSGFMQSVDSNDQNVDDFTMSGIDFGAALAMGDLGLRANYAMTKGTGNYVFGGHGFAGGAQEESADQWYLEATYVLGLTTIGASYGEGNDDLTGDETNLAMLFARYKATDAWTLMTELQSFENNANSDYTAFIVGSQFNF
ncbi:MAG: porin [unclassified Hahellaceae]|nr:porin [Hahellaceae bacterium]|tara:strand:- start:164 stop:1330 length:1167 start_codon:yes stop_codon:yes gene_type:complete